MLLGRMLDFEVSGALASRCDAFFRVLRRGFVFEAAEPLTRFAGSSGCIEVSDLRFVPEGGTLRVWAVGTISPGDSGLVSIIGASRITGGGEEHGDGGVEYIAAASRGSSTPSDTEGHRDVGMGWVVWGKISGWA